MSIETSKKDDLSAQNKSDKSKDDKKDIQGNGSGDPNASADIDDDGLDDSRKIFVGGLSWETSEKDLQEYFTKYGVVKTCTIKVDKYTSHSRGFGFVIFEEEESVAKVLANKEHKLNNKQIDPKKAKPNREPLKKIFVGGIDPSVTEEQIREYFGQYGKIESLDLPFDSNKNKRKAYIFVCFSTEAEAKKAAKEEKQDIEGKMCDVRIAVPKEQANRQRNRMPGNGWPKWNMPYPGYDFYPGYYNYHQPYSSPYDYYSSSNFYGPNSFGASYYNNAGGYGGGFGAGFGRTGGNRIRGRGGHHTGAGGHNLSIGANGNTSLQSDRPASK